MSLILADRTSKIKPSATLAVTAKAQELKRQGKNIISLGAGEPDFDTPEHIKQAAIEAINEGFTKYTPVDGIPDLKQAICDKLQNDNGLSYQLSQVLVSSGGKQSFFNMALALLQEGDEVVIPSPYWVSYPDMVAVTGATPVIVPCSIEQRFKLTAEALRQAITPKTKLVVFNSPSNPTGVAYSRKELTELAEVLLEHPQTLVATDDMYEHILWADEPFCNILMACPDLYDRTMVLNGVSKAYSMTGWRIGYAAGPEKLIQAMKKIQSQSTSNPCSISQRAALAALTGSQDCVKKMLKHFKQRHDFVVESLNEIPGISCLPSDGAFYAFPNVESVIKATPGVENDVELAELWLSEAGVAVVPGTAFGMPGCVRLSFATSMENLERALVQIGKAVGK